MDTNLTYRTSLHDGFGYREEDKHNCFCFENEDDGSEICMKSRKRKFARSCLSNIFISTILIAYTFVGAIVFLAIEGESVPSGYAKSGATNTTASTRFAKLGESRTRTVENIWDITVSLNILYRENWTRLAAQEINRFQDQIIQHLKEEMMTARSPDGGIESQRKIEWNFAKSFLYSLTILTTIGCGNIGPRTIVGKAATMGYAALGIPLMLVYLSSIGSLLSSCTRGVFTKSICCCLCSNCGYCCYDEKRMLEKELKMKKRREQKEYREQFYTRSPSTFTTSSSNTDELKLSATRTSSFFTDSDCPSSNLSAAPYTKHEKELSGNCLAPISFCFIAMVGYICGGSAVLSHLEYSFNFLDSVFFCFMTLSTIGFGDSIPASSVLTSVHNNDPIKGDVAIWFCSSYIFIGMALMAMCVNVVHDEVIYKLKSRYDVTKTRRMFAEGSFSKKRESDINFLNRESTGNNLSEYPLAS